jgi:hypothetical protein
MAAAPELAFRGRDIPRRFCTTCQTGAILPNLQARVNAEHTFGEREIRVAVTVAASG